MLQGAMRSETGALMNITPRIVSFNISTAVNLALT